GGVARSASRRCHPPVARGAAVAATRRGCPSHRRGPSRPGADPALRPAEPHLLPPGGCGLGSVAAAAPPPGERLAQPGPVLARRPPLVRGDRRGLLVAVRRRRRRL